MSIITPLIVTSLPIFFNLYSRTFPKFCRKQMGAVLFDLQQHLQTKPEKLTPQEVSIFLNCKANCSRGFTVGAVVGSGLTWIGTQRLSRLFRISLSVGAATIAGMWGLSSSAHSCLDQILALEGSRLQKELANIIVQRFPDDRRGMQLISKHFYSERVFDDSTSDQPKLRWRYRNFCTDNAAYSQRSQDSDYHSDSDSKQTDLESKQVPVQTNLESKRVPMNSGITLMADPFDCIFGHSPTGEESHHPDSDSSSVRPRVLNRSHKRSHRRRRLRHQDVPQTMNT